MFFSLQADIHNKCGFHQWQTLAQFLHMTISKHGKCFTPKVVVILICFVIFSFSFNEIADNSLSFTFTNDDHSAKSEIIAFVKTSYLILRFLSTLQ